MTDITKTVAPKTDQLNADDLFAGKTLTLRITGVKDTGSKDQPIAISYEGDNGKPWKPSLGMRRVLIELWGQEAAQEADKHYPGRMVTLFRDPDVKFGKDVVGGIRISHASDIKADMKIALTVAKARRVEFVVHPLKPTPMSTQAAPPPSPPVKKEEPLSEDAARIKGIADQIKGFIRDAKDAGDLNAVWTEYKTDLADIKSASPAAYDHLSKFYDKRMNDFNFDA